MRRREPAGTAPGRGPMPPRAAGIDRLRRLWPVALWCWCVLLTGAAQAQAPATPAPASVVGEAVCVRCHASENQHFGHTVHAQVFRQNPRNERERQVGSPGTELEFAL